jgi:hypothetical protein
MNKDIDFPQLGNHWDYRVVKRKISPYKDCSYFEVLEIYYDPEGRPRLWTVSPATLCSCIGPGCSDEELVKDMKGDAELMLQAFNKPVLDEEQMIKDIDEI